jgi:hypothetical protein
MLFLRAWETSPGVRKRCCWRWASRGSRHSASFRKALAGGIARAYFQTRHQRLLVPDPDGLVSRSGFVLRDAALPWAGPGRAGLGPVVVRVEEAAEHGLRRSHARSSHSGSISRMDEAARFVEACEQAYHFGKGRLAIYPVARAWVFSVCHSSTRLFPGAFIAQCDIEYRDPSPSCSVSIIPSGVQPVAVWTDHHH